MSNRNQQGHVDTSTRTRVLQGGDNGLASVRCPACRGVAKPMQANTKMLQCVSCGSTFVRKSAW